MNSKKSKTSKTNGGKSARIRGGRQILVVGLVALVLAAGYYRWTLGNLEESAVSVSSTAVPENGSSAGGSSAASSAPPAADAETFGSDKGGENKEEENKDENKDENGENNNENNNNNDGGSDVIMQSRRDRDKMRAETSDKWKEISSNSNASESAKKEAEENILKLTENTEKESVIETNVKSKGFEDCFAQISDSGVSVIVKGGKLDSAVVAQIKDIIVTETGESTARIKISAEE